MPASSNLVSLDHAKKWAKRLTKAPGNTLSLAQAQETVAHMLGHASWQALTRFYDTSLTPQTVAENSAMTQDPGQGSLFSPLLGLINARYPTLHACEVEVLAVETDEIEGGGSDLLDAFREFERDGYFPEDAVMKAVEKLSVRVHAPPGHSMIRVRDGQGKATLVIVSSDDYRRVMPDPTSR